MNETIISSATNEDIIEVKIGRIYPIIKRTIDLIFSFFGIIFLLFPITIIVKIMYLISGDKESIFYAQYRIGKNGELFPFYKYRSMVPNAKEELEKLLNENEELAKEYKINKKLKNDPRITKVGKILRKTSLDELPQLICILDGNMSIVGNRPYLPKEKEDMGNYYKDIVKTKPGLTGYWQVNGRSNTTFEERCKLESYYSKNASWKIDVKIFFKTFKVVLFGKDAK